MRNSGYILVNQWQLRRDFQQVKKIKQQEKEKERIRDINIRIERLIPCLKIHTQFQKLDLLLSSVGPTGQKTENNSSSQSVASISEEPAASILRDFFCTEDDCSRFL